jgi:hypothetical protein
MQTEEQRAATVTELAPPGSKPKQRNEIFIVDIIADTITVALFPVTYVCFFVKALELGYT